MNKVLFTSSLLGEQYYKVEHSSGMRIYVCPKEVCTAYAILTIGFGGNVTKYIKDGKVVNIPEGCAHFLEHKLFDNPDGTGADDVFSSLGAYCNAYTSNDRTAYFFSTTDNFDECLEHLVYFVTNPYFTKETVDKEQGIIGEEIRGCLDDPYDRCYLGMLDGMYFENPTRLEICGSEESISRITAQTLYKCCEDFYTPKNMTLCVCGNVSVEQVVRAVDKQLSLPCIEKAEIAGFTEPREIKRAYSELVMPVSKPIYSIGIKDNVILSDPVERCRRSVTATVLLHLLFSQSGKFYIDMLERGLISPGFDFGYSANANTAYVMISGESDDPEALLDEIKKHVAVSREQGFSVSDLEREKKCLYSSYVSDFDSSEDIAFTLNSYAQDDADMFLFPDVVKGIDAEAVTDLLNTLLDDEAYTLSVVKDK